MRGDRGQVTIFIIVGVIVLFVSLFLIALAGSLTKTKLDQEREKVLFSTVQKEGLRLFVEDCLRDELEQALILIGKQGGLFLEQGGSLVERAAVGNREVVYGIKRMVYQQENSYPCRSDGFCVYSYPDSSARFGELFKEMNGALLERLNSDLTSYLTKKTKECVEEFTREEISQQAGIIQGVVDQFKVTIKDEGIEVNVHYPFEVKIGGRTYFELSDFSFFYPSLFKQFVEFAILEPLRYDIRYVDFDYSQDTLEEDSFEYGCENDDSSLCTQNLNKGIYVDRLHAETAIAPLPGGEGNDLITVKTSAPIIENQPEYEFRVVRENRPPALDYINRCPLLDPSNPSDNYDYLITSGDTLAFDIRAWDPDEDKISYEIKKGDSSLQSYNQEENGVVVRDFSKNLNELDFTSPTIYTLIVTATDGNDSDWQDVRIKVRDPWETGVTIRNPLGVNLPITLEDPICVSIPQNIILRLGETNLPSGEYLLGEFAPLQGCTPENLKLLDITQIKTNLANYFAGDKNLEGVEIGAVDSCPQGEFPVQLASAQDCFPLEEPGYPYPYIYHPQLNELYKIKKDKTVNENLIPFQARSNVCCTPEGNYKDSGTPCFDENLQGCFSNEFHAEEIAAYCDGGRGNVCGPNVNIVPLLEGGNKKCGDPEMQVQCSPEISEECKGEASYRPIKDKGWCYENQGCTLISDQPIVYREKGEIQDDLIPATNPEQFDVGCKINVPLLTNDYEGHKCDKDFDGTFEGTCQGLIKLECKP